MCMNTGITEQDLYEALVTYCQYSVHEDLDQRGEDALGVIIEYQMEQFVADGHFDFSDKELMGKVSDIVCAHTLQSMIKKGIIECDIGDDRDKDMFKLTELGQEMAKILC